MNCPKTISAALFQVQNKATRLVHDSENSFQSYKYVSVDRYYEYIRPLLNDAGIMIIPNEVESGLSPDGKTLKLVFEFHILHKDGDVWEFPIRRTVYIPYNGAQAIGSALSYADKFILRTLFKLSTGEEADVEHEIKQPTVDADAGSTVRGGQDPVVDFDYAGAPYRVFGGGNEINKTFTAIETWGVQMKKNQHIKTDLNTKEVNRVRGDVKDSQDMTENAKAKMLASIDGLGVTYEA